MSRRPVLDSWPGKVGGISELTDLLLIRNNRSFSLEEDRTAPECSNGCFQAWTRPGWAEIRLYGDEYCSCSHRPGYLGGSFS